MEINTIIITAMLILQAAVMAVFLLRRKKEPKRINIAQSPQLFVEWFMQQNRSPDAWAERKFWFANRHEPPCPAARRKFLEDYFWDNYDGSPIWVLIDNK